MNTNEVVRFKLNLTNKRGITAVHTDYTGKYHDHDIILQKS